MNTEQECKDLIAGVIEWLDIHDDNKLVALAEPFLPKPKRVGYVLKPDLADEYWAVELDDEVRARLGPSGGVDWDSPVFTQLAARIGDDLAQYYKEAFQEMVASASVEVEE